MVHGKQESAYAVLIAMFLGFASVREATHVKALTKNMDQKYSGPAFGANNA